jgi:hypothetical protein
MRKICRISLLISIFLVFTINASAILPSSTVQCNSDGVAEFRISYVGEKFLPEDISINALKKISENSFAVKGQLKVENVSSINDYFGEATIFRFVTEKNFTTKGAYSVEFSIKNYKMSFTFECPGIFCKFNENCNDLDFCNSDGFCEVLKCNKCELPINHGCSGKCDDKNVCTEDFCSNGTCLNRKIANCCYKDSNCNDGFLCTDDLCMNYRCINRKIQCREKECQLSECREYLGCSYETNETCVKEKQKFQEFLSSSLMGKIFKSMMELFGK